MFTLSKVSDLLKYFACMQRFQTSFESIVEIMFGDIWLVFKPIKIYFNESKISLIIQTYLEWQIS